MAIRLTGFAILVLGILVLGTSAQLECKGDVGAIIFNCRKFELKGKPQIPPSKPCCEALKASDIVCLCKHVPPIAEQFISMKKAIYVATICGCKIPPPAYKCGSYTIPPSPPPRVHPSPTSPPPKA